jgi:hypothetical protein
MLPFSEAVCCVAATQMEAQVAAAAAAVADLSGRLLKANHQAQQSSWQSELAAVLQQQQSKLQAWAQAQVMVAVAVMAVASYCMSACTHNDKLSVHL